MSTRRLATLLLLAAAAVAGEAEPPVVHHGLAVRLDPAAHTLDVRDELAPGTLAAGAEPLRFTLHDGLDVTVEGPYVLEKGGTVEGAVPLRTWILKPAGGAWPADARVRLRWHGTLYHPLEQEEQEYARSFSRSPGLIDAEGVVLSGASGWVPAFEGAFTTFRLACTLPEGWTAVSQGTLDPESGAWTCPHPMDEIYLIAAPFTVYRDHAGKVATYAFLRTPDPALAAKYLETTAQYLEMYRQLLGPYPFGKFALVENFWETGYGMPSFTLLGPQIIRFPFILHSSYPHEILHNWWGNSVYVQWEKGNWCEGLTAYLADHLIREGQGQGEAYRRDTLEKYRAYVRGEQDFPLTAFRSRHSSATEAVGYGKSLMLFHMLRRRLGDARFVDGLRAFYARFRFREACFDDLAQVMGEVAGTDLRPFFAQWVERTGAPALALEERDGRLFLRQTQAGEPYVLDVPVAWTVEGENDARVAVVPLAGRETELKPPAGAVRVDVDPAFDLFRVLDRGEIPATLGQVFGADRVTLVLPADGGEKWQALVAAWRKEGAVEVVSEEELAALPADRSVWILGAGNRWARALAPALEARHAGVTADTILLGAARLPRAGHAFVFAVPHPADAERTVGWIGADVPASIPGLARKLPHYGKYSWLAFAGDEPANVAKGQWEGAASPLVWHADRARGALPERAPLARLAPVFDAERLMAHVRWLADDARRGRGAGTPELDACADYIAAAFERAGLAPGGDDGTWFQAWQEEGGPDGKPVTLKNVVGVLPGTDPAWKEQSVVVGAHYDHLGLGWPDVREGNAGQVHNGADDNASGVAVLLEVAAALKAQPPRRTIVFVAFSGEEWGLKGSRHYVAAMRRWPAAQALAMVNLDTVGRLGDRKLTVLGSGTADEWKHIAMGVGYTTGVEATCIPQDPGGSDQVAFHEARVPAVQLFTGAHADYHRPTDDADQVDGAGLVRVATFLKETVAYLAGREQPLTSALGGAVAPRPEGGARKVSLGTLPDFAFGGPGVKVASVMDGSAAAAAGIRAGDVLLALGDRELADLRSLSEALKAHAPGDAVKIRLRRDGEELTLDATLKAR